MKQSIFLILFTYLLKCFVFLTNIKYFQAVIEDEKSNLICSPVSISMVLTMAAFGAKGETEEKLCSALHLCTDDEITRTGYRDLIKSLNVIIQIYI